MMSAEVLKKRGRPKKVASEPISIEREPVKKGTRQKSTKASGTLPTIISNKAMRSSSTTQEDSSIASIAGQKRTRKAQASATTTNTPSPPTTSQPGTSEATPAPQNSQTPSPPKVTAANSKILNQIRALSSKAPSAAKGASATTILPSSNPPSSPTISKNTKSPSRANAMKTLAPEPSPKPSLLQSQQGPAVSSQTGEIKTSSSPPLPIPSTPKPQSQPPQTSIPIAAINSSIVSQISSRAGARPPRLPAKLPAQYKPAARRVTLVIVALPIALVTSWILYQRFILGEEPKKIVRPGMVMVGENPSTREKVRNIPEEDK